MKNVPTNLINLKTKVDKFNVDKSLPVPVGLSKLSDVVKNDVVKKDVYSAKIKNIKDKIPDITNVATKATLNAKINEVKGEIPNLNNKTTLNAAENKIPSVSNLVKKTNYNTKINEIENKITDHNHDTYVTTPEFNNSTSKYFAARLGQANLASKRHIGNFVNKADFNNQVKNITSNKNELNELSKKVKAISTKVLTKSLIDKFSIHNGAKHFSSGIFQNYLVFIPAIKHIKYFHGITQLYLGKSNRMSEESIKKINKSDSYFVPAFADYHSLPDINYNGHCLIKNISVPKKVINLYISYTLKS